MIRSLVVTGTAVWAGLCGAATAPNNAAIEAVFRQTVEQSPQQALEMKPGARCAQPKVQRFKVLRRGLFKHDAATGRGYFPVTAEVEMRCANGAPAEQRWNGQLEMQLYENSLNAWTVRW